MWIEELVCNHLRPLTCFGATSRLNSSASGQEKANKQSAKLFGSLSFFINLQCAAEQNSIATEKKFV